MKSARKKKKSYVEVTKEALHTLIKSQSQRVSFCVPDSSNSSIWKAFTLVILDGESTRYVSCNTCRKLMVSLFETLRLIFCIILILIQFYHTATGTGNLQRHGCAKIATTSKASIKDYITSAVVYCIAKDLRSPNFIQGKGFENLADVSI